MNTKICTLQSLLRMTAAFGVLLCLTALASAQATRTWVSGVGDDANPCSRTAPCKTFAGAIAKTSTGGEIDVLDPGGFGALTITKSISIESEGVIGGVLVSGTNGFVVAAPGANVVLRGLTFEGLGTGLAGISVSGVGELTVENCFINNFTAQGINFAPSSGTSAELYVKDTVIRNNSNTTNGVAILVAPAAGIPVTGTIDNVRMENNLSGVRVQDNSQIVVRNSQATGNLHNGFTVAVTSVAATMTLETCVASNNGSNG
ncbi:MAG TPA: right-handed parallel beta-helix repeat-containing protein, partial [Blastocatellia bacterium]